MNIKNYRNLPNLLQIWRVIYW